MLTAVQGDLEERVCTMCCCVLPGPNWLAHLLPPPQQAA
jgi:hypothetical protein